MGRASPYVFHDAAGATWDSDIARARIAKQTIRATQRAGIKDASFHTLRHTCASWMAQAGAPILSIRDFMRHTSVVQTERYMHLAPRDVNDAAAILDRAIAGPVGDILETTAETG